MTTTRTDAHRPSAPEFDPEAYDLVGVYDLNPGQDAFQSDHAQRIADVNRLIDQGYRFASHQSGGQCGHCGAHIRYAALMAREDIHEMIYVGEICLGNRFEGLTKTQFDALRKAAQLDREKQAKLAGFNQFLVDHPEIVPATYVRNLVAADDNLFGAGWALSTIEDIMGKARTYGGQISEKQIAFVIRLVAEIEEKIANYTAPAQAGPAPEGKQTVEGAIISIKSVEGYMGGTAWKMTVKLDNGSRVYGTMPTSLSNAEKSTRVTFTATFTPKDDDTTFAWFKRPTLASIIS